MIDSSYFDTIHNRYESGCAKYSTPPQGSKESVIPMWIADMDFKSPPAVTDALIKVAQHGIYGYGTIGEDYNRIISKWYKNRMNWDIAEEEILNVPTVLFGVATAIRALTKPGDSILICQPVYYPFAKIIPENNCNLVVNELVLNNGRYEIDFEDFENKIKENNVKVFLFCSPHNPVGRVWTKEELENIARICIENNVYIISDEIHSDFIYKDYSHTPIASLSEEFAQRTVTCIAPTKTFNLAGLKGANVVVPNEEIRKCIERECSASGYGGLNIMASTALVAAYTEGEQWLDSLIDYLSENVEILKKYFPKEAPVSVMNMEGTYLAWLDCRKLNLTSNEINDLFLKKAGVWLHKGSTFGNGGDGFMRMNIACPASVLKEASERILNSIQ